MSGAPVKSQAAATAKTAVDMDAKKIAPEAGVVAETGANYRRIKRVTVRRHCQKKEAPSANVFLAKVFSGECISSDGVFLVKVLLAKVFLLATEASLATAAPLSNLSR